MQGKALLIENEANISRMLDEALELEQFDVKHASDGSTGLRLAIGEDWDIILHNIILPDMDGFELLTKIREHKPHVPVILITARDDVTDKVRGLDLGANDYVTKPFVIEELMARIRSAIRVYRNIAGESEPELLRIGSLLISPMARTVIRDGEEIELTPREYELLYYLARNAGRVMSREDILADVWGYDFAGDTNVVDVYIRYLRQKIDQGRRDKLIQTSRGVGYRIKQEE